jgi:DNA-directed RNA polymerase specialized sigma24 family protein
MVHRSDADRSITAAGLARLLARLDPDAERAGIEYEKLRRVLVKFFDWRGAWPPDECADVALDRLARKLEEETSVQDVRSYAHGIARLVLLERRRQPVFSSIDGAHDVASVPASPHEDEDELLRDCLDRCLAETPAEGRSIVVRYYEGERHAKISNRRRLADTLGVSENALRSRVHRLRDRIEHCVQACVSQVR